MGYITNNLITKGFTGKIGDDVVFRQVGNRTIVAKRPCKRTTFTPNQAVQQSLFQRAVCYGRTILINDVLRADYKAAAEAFKLRGAYNAAIIDYMRMPEVAAINNIAYTGKAGQPLQVFAHNPFKIIACVVTIKLADGSVLETGLAQQTKQGDWVYTTQLANTTIAGSIIEIVVSDRLKRTGVKEVVL